MRLATALMLAATILITGCGSQATTWQRIQENGVLRVGLDPTFPPFESSDGNELRGLDVDLARAVASDLELKAEFVSFGYDGLYDALDTEQVDVLISAMAVAPERLRDFAYSEPYFNAGQVLVLPTDSPVDDLSELDGKILAVELGTEGHLIGTEWQRQYPNLKVDPYDSGQLALEATANGQARAALVDSISGRLFVRGRPSLRLGEEPVSDNSYAMVVRVEDEKLLEELNGSLRRLRSTNQLANILSNWLD